MRCSIFLVPFVLVVCGCGDAPATDTPATDAPATDAPATDAPATDAPATDAPPTIDGYTYKTVKIGKQEWFAENLRTTVYANGDEIPYSRTVKSWTTQEFGMRASYDHDDAFSAQYGQLYNWYAVDDKRGLCPTGWRVPSEEDWQDLEVFLGVSRADVSLFPRREWTGVFGIGTKLMAKSGWKPGVNGTDDFGFSALPGGYRNSHHSFFLEAGLVGYWWSSSPRGGNAWARLLSSRHPDIRRFSDTPGSGFSVRCLRDAD